MCGRARLSSDLSEIKIAFGIPPERPAPNFAASWNVAPTDPLPIVRFDAKDKQRTLEIMRWGLIPYWAKDIKIGLSTINARAEEVDTKPAFREAYRCLPSIFCASSIVIISVIGSIADGLNPQCS
jgi:putative SOS response-associated peptidase YedK